VNIYSSHCLGQVKRYEMVNRQNMEYLFHQIGQIVRVDLNSHIGAMLPDIKCSEIKVDTSCEDCEQVIYYC
jgi:hypothetical protein